METLLIALLAGIGFIVAYYTYGRWLGSKIFRLSADTICPSERLNDGVDYVPTKKSVVFGHHFTSIAGTGPIVGPAIAIMSVSYTHLRAHETREELGWPGVG